MAATRPGAGPPPGTAATRRRRRRSAARRRAGVARISSRACWSGDPGARLRDRHHRPGRPRVRGWRAGAVPRVHARALPHVRAARGRSSSRASSALIGLAAAAYWGDRAPGAAGGGGVDPADLPARSRDARARGGPAHRTGMAITLPGGRLDRPRARARDPAARARRPGRARRGHHRRRPGRDVRGRHRRLPRRALPRPAPARAADLAQQDRRGPAHRHDHRDRRARGARASTRTGSRTARRCCSASRWRSRRRSATCSSPRSSATPAPRTPGSLFGAHGGALDRLDAAFFSPRRRLLRLPGHVLRPQLAVFLRVARVGPTQEVSQSMERRPSRC